MPNITNKLTPTKAVWNVLERRFGTTLLRLAMQHTIPGHESGTNKLSHHAAQTSNQITSVMIPAEIQRSVVANCSGTERRNTPAMVGARLASIAFPPIELGAVTGTRKRTSSAGGAVLSAHLTNGSTLAMTIDAAPRISNQTTSSATLWCRACSATPTHSASSRDMLSVTLPMALRALMRRL